MQSSFSDLEYAAKKKRRDRFLAEIEAITPWPALEAEIEPFYPKGDGRGRPPIGLQRMLRMYVAQQCFGLSDEGIEDAIYDSQAIRAFVGIDLARESAPDATTLLKFRRLLEEHELTRKIFERIKCHLAEKGLMMREGTIVDATLIAAPLSTKNRDKGRDPEMHQASLPLSVHRPVRRQGARFHCRNRINWSADSARTPNIRCPMTLVPPWTRTQRPPYSSLRRALLRSATVRSL